jgi:hypothetical protein
MNIIGVDGHHMYELDSPSFYNLSIHIYIYIYIHVYLYMYLCLYV